MINITRLELPISSLYIDKVLDSYQFGHINDREFLLELAQAIADEAGSENEDQLRDEGYREGVDIGFEEGFEEGHSKGFDEGEAIGLSDGKEVGQKRGYEKGLDDGYEAGYDAAKDHLENQSLG